MNDALHQMREDARNRAMNDLAAWYPLLASTGVPTPRTRVVRTDIPLIELRNDRPLAQPWVARVVEGSDLVKQFVSALQGVGAHTRVADTDIVAPSPPDDSRHRLSARTAADLLCQLNDDLGLPTFQAEVWQEDARYLGGTTTGCIPVVQRLPVLRGGTDESKWRTAEDQANEIDALALHLFDLNHRAETRATLAPASGRVFLEMDAKAAVGVQQSSRVSEFSAIMSHALPPSLEYNRRARMYVSFLPSQRVVSSEVDKLTAHSERVARFFHGWSVDCARAKDGRWWAIDMALADMSWHWPGCEQEARDA